MFTFDFRDVSFAHKAGFSSSPKDEFHKHMHHFYELIYFEEGEVEFHVEGLTQKLSPGDIVFIQPGQFHFAVVDHDYDYRRYVCKMPENILPTHIVESVSHFEPFFTSCENLLPLFEALEGYAEEFLSAPEDMRTLCLAKVLELLVRLSRKEGVHLEEKRDSVARGLVDYIEAHLSERLTLESLSAAFHYSTSYIATSFRKEMHVSLISYVRGKKVMAAHSLILHGVKPSDAASMMGFQDYSTFFRSYQKMLGFPPSSAKRGTGEPGIAEE